MKPYIITDETTNEEIGQMIERAYKEGYADGHAMGIFEASAKANQTIASPIIQTTPYYSSPPNITCELKKGTVSNG